MQSLSRHRFLAFLLLLTSLPAHAEDGAAGAQEKPMLVVTFANSHKPDPKLDDALQQAEREFSVVRSVSLPDERALPIWLDEHGDNVGLVVLIHPQDEEITAKLPSLYPDLQFSMIDIDQPHFSPNVQTLRFLEEEGAFLLGAIAAIRSNTPVTIFALDETARNKKMATAFRAGVHHVQTGTTVSEQLNLRPSSTQRMRLAGTVDNAFQSGVGVIFAIDDEVVDYALRAARPERKLVISSEAPPTGTDTSRLLTYMVKRYDLALLDVLRIYAHKQWHASTILLGVSGGYIDYSLNTENVDIFPKDSIDQIEAIKDHIAQGIVK
jgi:basic membrane protein A and related proteins